MDDGPDTGYSLTDDRNDEEKPCDCGQIGEHDCIWQYFDSLRQENHIPMID